MGTEKEENEERDEEKETAVAVFGSLSTFNFQRKGSIFLVLVTATS